MPKLGDKVVLRITDLSHDGAGVGRLDKLVVFVAGALPGENVEIEITEMKKNYGRARLLTILVPSGERISPPCPIYEVCGGCQLQHLEYQAQLNYKRERIEKALARIGNLKGVTVKPVMGMDTPWRYRNKAQLHAACLKGKLKLGYYRSGSRKLIWLQDCLLLPQSLVSLQGTLEEKLNEYMPAACGPRTKEVKLKHVILKHSEATGEIMIVFVTASPNFPQGLSLGQVIMDKHPKVQSVVQNINPENRKILGQEYHLLAGKGRIKEKLGSLEFLLSAPAFFQVNTKQATTLCEKVLEYANLAGTETVFDLYCGTGALSLWLAGKTRRVYGLEINPGAVDDARANASLNGIENTEFVSGAVERTLPALISARKIKPDLVVLDPPRQGVALSVLKEVAKAVPPALIYVSCDPGTLARDLGILGEMGYKIREIQPIDMFPQTSHVETVALMSRAKE